MLTFVVFLFYGAESDKEADWVKVSIKQDRLMVTAGGAMEYICEAVGSPSPSIVWLKDGLPIKVRIQLLFLAQKYEYWLLSVKKLGD